MHEGKTKYMLHTPDSLYLEKKINNECLVLNATAYTILLLLYIICLVLDQQ